MSELERMKTVLEFTRDHNRKLVEENARLRAALPVPEPTQDMVRLQEQLMYLQARCIELESEVKTLRAREPIAVTVHPDLMPPKSRSQERRNRGIRSYAYAGEKPLRTLWPLEE